MIISFSVGLHNCVKDLEVSRSETTSLQETIEFLRAVVAKQASAQSQLQQELEAALARYRAVL